MVDFKKARHPMVEEALKNNVHKGHQAAFAIREVGETDDNPETALVPVESQAVTESSYAEGLHISKSFAAPTLRRGGDTDSEPRLLQWLTGNNPMFAANGKTPLENAKGFFIDKPDEDEMYLADYELLDAMDTLCEQGLAREVVVEHYNDGRPNRVAAWQFMDIVSLFVVCEGVPSRYEMEREDSDRWGIAYGWPKSGGLRSKLRFRCFVKELMDAGCDGSFLASFSSFCTERVIKALREQNDILEIADMLRSSTGETDPMPYYAYALPLRCSVKTLTASNGKKSQAQNGEKSKEIYYPIPAIPRLSKRNPGSAMAYLAAMAITEEQALILESNGRVERAVEWSVKESAKIISGKDDDASEESPVNEAPLTDVKPPF